MRAKRVRGRCGLCGKVLQRGARAGPCGGGAGPGRAAAHRDHGIIALLRAESCESSSHTAERRQDSASLRYDALSLIRATKSTGAVDMDGAARRDVAVALSSAPRARTHPAGPPRAFVVLASPRRAARHRCPWRGMP